MIFYFIIIYIIIIMEVAVIAAMFAVGYIINEKHQLNNIFNPP